MKKLITMILAIAMCLTMVACGGSDKEDNTITIGYIGPLTGEASAFGIPELNSMKMNIENLNENGGIGGREIILKTYDTRNDNVETANVAKKAITVDKVSALVGVPTSGSAIALNAVCEEYNVPFVGTCCTNPLVTENEDGSINSFAFRTVVTDNTYGSVMADYIYNKLGMKTVGILQEISSDYSVGVAEAFAKAYTALGGEVLAIENYNTGDVEFRAQLTVLKEANPEALFMPMLYKELALCVQQATGLGITQQLCGSDVWTNIDLIDMAGEGIYGAIHVDGFNFADPALEDFNAEFEERYDASARQTGANAYLVYDALMLIKAAVEKCGSTDPGMIRDALEGISGVQGVSCTLGIDEKHRIIRDVYIYESTPEGQICIDSVPVTYD